ncbi:aminotransferase class I/II-fold pyridoxal phosphate-dependent enzyme [Gracilinema caldarium]|uniref:aminotransferase class I/II-fold pyridoxal phosphate-dependent enzyme n=1 Tax=Gracilinema caldarium TaxID=215591 RepID=UPI0002F8516E|nr:aminotransferase class I/II-fold pyridoxal phosphate-dependent enzyme [Gracilinema caldarium]
MIHQTEFTHSHGYHGGNRSLLLQRARSLGWTGADAAFIDASVNLNPLGPPDFLKEVLFQSYERLVEYPDPSYGELSALVIQYHQCNSNMDVVFGNGADDLIFALPRMLKKITGGRALIRIPSYGSYQEALELAGFAVQTEQNWDRFFCKFDERLDDEPDTMWFGAPNNPDGELPQDYPDGVVAFARKKPKIYFVIDESFIDFTLETSLLNREMVPQNIIVLRSLTKLFAVPGLRIGYGILSKELGYQLRKELPNWPLNSLAEAFSRRVFSDASILDFIQRTKQYVATERSRIMGALSSWYDLCPSKGNFFLLRPRDGAEQAGAFLRDYCLRRGLALRDCSNFPGLGSSWSRLGLKNFSENDQMLKILLDFVGAHSSMYHATTHKDLE